MASAYVVTREGQIHGLQDGRTTICGRELGDGATEYVSLQDLKDVTRQVTLQPCAECLGEREVDYLQQSP